MEKEPKCHNCHSPRRSIKALGLCSTCFTWQRRIKNYTAKLECAGNSSIKYNTHVLQGNIRVAKRVLEELRWREDGLVASATDTEYLESLVCILASACSSKLAFNTGILIEQMSPKSRRKIYEVLLSIVENIPSDWPKLHFIQYPQNGNHGKGNEGWGGWIRESKLSREHLEKIKATNS